jgi:prepilin-type N-terminal cleavage/methylation domain-containing protein
MCILPREVAASRTDQFTWRNYCSYPELGASLIGGTVEESQTVEWLNDRGWSGGTRRPSIGTAGDAGVTLVELMVVLALLALLGFASMVALGNVREITRTKGAAEQVASAIQQTRSFAVMHTAKYEITFPGGNQIAIGCVENCDASSPGDGPTPLVHELTVTAPGPPIWFKSTGASNGGSVVVNPGADQKTVSVTLAGRVDITPP